MWSHEFRQFRLEHKKHVFQLNIPHRERKTLSTIESSSINYSLYTLKRKQSPFYSWEQLCKSFVPCVTAYIPRRERKALSTIESSSSLTSSIGGLTRSQSLRNRLKAGEDETRVSDTQEEKKDKGEGPALVEPNFCITLFSLYFLHLLQSFKNKVL